MSANEQNEVDASTEVTEPVAKPARVRKPSTTEMAVEAAEVAEIAAEIADDAAIEAAVLDAQAAALADVLAEELAEAPKAKSIPRPTIKRYRRLYQERTGQKITYEEARILMEREQESVTA